MTTQELFDFVTNLCFADDAVDDHLEAVQRMIADRPVDRTNEEQVDEVVFMNTFIPRSFGEVLHSEREQLAYQDGTMEKAFVTAISRLELEQITTPGSVARGARIMDLLNEEDDREIDSCDKEDDIDAEDDSDQGNGYEVDEPERSRSSDVPLTDEQRSVYRQEKREGINI
ncbi:hypothetical protein Plhal304r1_c020g0070741 [Plasmopara halstedii]